MSETLPVFTRVTLFTDSDGRARWRDEPIVLGEGNPQFRVAPAVACSEMQLREILDLDAMLSKDPAPESLSDDDDGDDDGTEERQGPVQRGAGSGVVIDAKGYILTNNHVVGDADDIKVQFIDGKELPAKIVGTDSRSDLAVIRVEAKDYALKAAKHVDAEIDKAQRKLDEDPGLVPDEWKSYTVAPGEVEFWQGSPDRRHWRLSYQRVAAGWDRTRLWP